MIDGNNWIHVFILATVLPALIVGSAVGTGAVVMRAAQAIDDWMYARRIKKEKNR